MPERYQMGATVAGMFRRAFAYCYFSAVAVNFYNQIAYTKGDRAVGRGRTIAHDCQDIAGANVCHGRDYLLPVAFIN